MSLFPSVCLSSPCKRGWLQQSPLEGEEDAHVPRELLSVIRAGKVAQLELMQRLRGSREDESSSKGTDSGKNFSRIEGK